MKKNLLVCWTIPINRKKVMINLIFDNFLKLKRRGETSQIRMFNPILYKKHVILNEIFNDYRN